MRIIAVERDPRGASKSYEPYLLVARDAMTGRVVWVEGVRRDYRAAMYPDVLSAIEPQIQRLNTGKEG